MNDPEVLIDSLFIWLKLKSTEYICLFPTFRTKYMLKRVGYVLALYYLRST